MLTGVGKRYDIVACFRPADATVVAADPTPLAPAQYAAHGAARCRRSTTRPTCPRCASCANNTASAPCCR